MTTKLETMRIMAIILIIAFLLTGAYAIGQTDKKQKRTSFICMFISALIEIGLYFF